MPLVLDPAVIVVLGEAQYLYLGAGWWGRIAFHHGALSHLEVPSAMTAPTL